MKEMQFTVEIKAPKERVWQTLWQDQSFREWAGIIDPGTYMKGELKESGTVEFISAENGYGVTSLVDKLAENELLVLRHSADTQENGQKERKEQWTGGKETYSLVEKNDGTTLTATFDVPLELEDHFKDTYPKAFNKIKNLAEEE